jgi:hypothetical protein
MRPLLKLCPTTLGAICFSTFYRISSASVVSAREGLPLRARRPGICSGSPSRKPLPRVPRHQLAFSCVVPTSAAGWPRRNAPRAPIDPNMRFPASALLASAAMERLIHGAHILRTGPDTYPPRTPAQTAPSLAVAINASVCLVPPAHVERHRLPTTISLSKINHAALALAVYASQLSFPLSRS